MEIQRNGNDRLEIILDARTLERQKEEIAQLEGVIQTWKQKCSTAAACSVALAFDNKQSSELEPLLNETVSSVAGKVGIAVDCSTDGEAEEIASDDSEAIATRKSHLKDLIMLAVVDGQFDAEEQKMILKIGQEMGFSERRVNSIYNESVLNPDHIESAPSKDPEERLQHLANLCHVILADGKVADWESVLVFPLAVKLGFDADDVTKMLEKIKNSQ